MNAEAPIDVSPADNSTNEPEPYLIVLKREFATFVEGNPQPPDISLAVEIADSTRSFDLTTTASLYARAGIVEYGVLDIAGRRFFCHRDPLDGRYMSVAIYREDEAVSPRRRRRQSSSPDRRLRVKAYCEYSAERRRGRRCRADLAGIGGDLEGQKPTPATTSG